MGHWRSPPRSGPSYVDHLAPLKVVGWLPLDPASAAVQQAAWGSLESVVREGSGFFVFSNWVVFSIFTTFLLPLWSMSFATEGLGREREGTICFGC